MTNVSKKCFRKSLSILLMATFLVTLTLNTAHAATLSRKVEGSSNFQTTWSMTAGSNTCKIVYGFNKFAIDEDTVHGYHASNEHRVYLIRGETPTGVKRAGPGRWARQEVRHTVHKVTYVMIY